MTTQSENNWSGAVQRELDGLQRSVDARFADIYTRLDKLLTLTEYRADKRVTEIQMQGINEKIDDNETDIARVHNELREALTALRHELTAALASETDDRKKTFKEFLDAKKAQFRWLVSMVMIPLGIAIVDLVMKHK
jgi:hypothetical protein